MGQPLSKLIQYCGNDNSFNTTNSHNNIVNMNAVFEDETPQILQWLSTSESENRHWDLRDNRLDGVGSWLLETDGFRKWENKGDGSSPGVLFCHGNPGVGKTYISSLVIDTLCDHADGVDIAVAGLYCDFLKQKEQFTTNMLGDILKQLIGRENTPEYVREAFQRRRDRFGGGRPGRLELLKMLKKAIQTRLRVFICIDGLDECLPDNRRELLECLRDISCESPGVRIFLASRTHIKDEVEKYFTSVCMIHIVPSRDDIRIYLEMKLDRDTEFDAMDDSLRTDIMKTVPKTISEIFLLVSLKMDSILGETTIYQRRKRLDEVTSGQGVGDAYSATIERLKAQTPSRSSLGMQVLMWVSHSERPLRVEELCCALGVESGSCDLNPHRDPSIRTLLGCSLGLVTVDSSSSTVRLVHSTLQEYLYANPNLFHHPHSTIAGVCLTYLNSQCIRDLPITIPTSLETTPFAQYASCYWGTHARKGMTQSIKSLALELLDRYHQHIFSSIVLKGVNDPPPHPDGPMSIEGFTELHCIALFGIPEMVIDLLETGNWDINGRDITGSTPLTWAVIKGHDRVVEILLDQRDINPNTRDIQERTPLFWAAGMGHETIVRMFLDRADVDVDSSEYKSGQTPFLWAAGNGCEGVVKLLLDRNLVNPNMTDNTGRTSVSLAAASGCDGVLKILLDHKDISPDTADISGRTPVSWATENGCKGALEILLRRGDVNPNATGYGNGQTPLLWAAENGDNGLARILLSRRDVVPGAADYRGRTPISWAARNGHERVVNLLLECGEIGLNIAESDYGRTPLLWAAKRGHRRIVETLLERKDINSNTRDNKGRTPLFWAAGMGYEEIVRMLLDRKDVDANIPEYESGQTPFLYAASNGCDGVVTIFLDRDDIDPNAQDNMGQTPILLAASGEYEEMVKILLDHGGVEPDIADRMGRTPTSSATENGHKGILETLLKRQDVNPNVAVDESGQTPLLWAAENGHAGLVRTLLRRKDVDPNMADDRGRTPISWAAENGHERVVRLLLSQKGIDVNIAENDSGRTPLLEAAENGRTGVVKLLLERKDINPDRPENYFGQTPLSWAAENGHEGVVEVFLARKDVGHNRKDNRGRTPLMLAAGNGREGVVKMLLERKDVDPNTAEYISGRTPLMWAARNGHEGVVKMLLEKNTNPDTADMELGQTALSQAAGNGCVRVVKMLLERKDVDLNREDENGRTPLSWAAFRGHARVVNVLLGREDIDTEAADTRYGLTPLSWAALRGREGAVKLLRKREQYDTDSEDTDSETDVPGDHAPSVRTTEDIFRRVKVQLDDEDVSRMFPRVGNFSPISTSPARPEHSPPLADTILKAPKKAIRMLRNWVNSKPKETHSSPGSLVWNVEDEYAEVVKMLLDHLDLGGKPPEADSEPAGGNSDKEEGSGQTLIPSPTQDHQAIVACPKFPEVTELLLDWRFVATSSICILFYWFWVFA